MADGVEIGQAYLSLIPSARNFGKQVTSAAAPGLLSAGGILGKLAAHPIETAIATAVAAGAGLVKLGSSFEEAFKTIRVTTGQTGKSLQGLEGDFKAVLKQRPDSLKDVSTAIAGLNQRLHLTGPQLKDTAKQFLRLSSLTKTDLKTNIDTVSKVFVNFGITASQQAGKLDELFRASQATGVGVSELAQQLATAGPVTRQLGLSFEDSAALLGTLSKAGIDAGQVFPAFSKAIAFAAKNGKSAKQVFQETFDAIRKAPSDTKAASAAIATFGARAGPKFAALIRSGQLSYADLVKTITSGHDSITKAALDTQTFGTKLKILKNTVLVALQPLATKLFNGLGDLAAKLTPVIAGVIGFLGNGLTAALTKAGQFLQPFATAVQTVFALVTAGFRGATSDNFFVRFGADIKGAVDAVSAFFNTLRTGFTVDEGTPVEEFALSVRAAFASLYAIGLQVGQVIRDTVVPAFVSFAKSLAPIGAAIGRFIKANPKVFLIGLGVALLAGTIAFSIFGAAATEAAVAEATALAPAILVGLAIGALAAAVLYAYTHFKIFRTVVDTTGRVLKTVALGIVQFGKGLFSVFKTVFGFVVTTVRNAMKVVSGIIEIVSAIISGDWGKLWDGVKKVVGGVWGEIKAIVSTGFTLLGDLFRSLGPILGKLMSLAWKAVKTAVVAGIKLSIDVITKLPESAVKALANIATKLVPKGLELLGGFLLGLAQKLPELVTFMVELPAKLAGKLVNIAGPLLSKAIDFLGGFLVGLITKLPDLFTFMIELPGKLAGQLVKLAEKLVAKAVSFLGGFLKGLKDKLPDLITFMVQLPIKLDAKLVNMQVKLIPKGIQFLGGFLTGMKEELPSLLQFCALLPLKLTAAFIKFENNLIAVGFRFLAGFLTGMLKKVPDILRFEATIPGKILHALGDVHSLLFHAGTELISGLIDGLKSKAKDLPGTVGGILKKGVTDLVPNSPAAKVGPLHDHPPESWGKAIGGGLIKSLQSQQAGVHAAMDGLVSRTPTIRAANLGVADGAAAPLGQGSKNINFYGDQHFHDGVDFKRVEHEFDFYLASA